MFLDRTKESWKKAIQRDGLDAWKHIYGGQHAKTTIVSQFDIQHIPVYILIHPDGEIIGRYASADINNEKTIKDLRQDLADIFKTNE